MQPTGAPAPITARTAQPQLPASAVHELQQGGDGHMTWIGNFYGSAIGKKAVMAVTGLILFGFVFFHMAGNLKVYFGPQHFNDYARFLRTVGAPLVPESVLLWIARIILLAAVVFHIHAAYALTIMNQQARPVGYRDRDYIASTYAARTMRWGGVIILLFILYHIAHLTLGLRVAPAPFIHGDVYHNFIAGFQVPWVSAIYIIANLALGFHLYHGVWSMFNSLGLNHPKFNPWRRHFATAFAVIITAGNLSFPLAVLLGVLK
jgi:succinate dehydrogenase / fumarate reductase cytochrome b subunit